MSLKTPKLTFLHVMLIVLSIGVFVRFSDLSIAIAKTAPEPKTEKVEAGKGATKDDEEPKEADVKPTEKPAPAEPSSDELGAADYGVLQQLGERRKQLEDREKQLDQREALLKAAKAEIAEKYKELDSVRAEIKTLLGQQSAAEEARLTSLVKVYEGMKATEAAAILNTLDMDVLMQVMGRMSERKLSPVLAKMDPNVARDVTIQLAKQRQLPEGADALSTPAPVVDPTSPPPLPATAVTDGDAVPVAPKL